MKGAVRRHRKDGLRGLVLSGGESRRMGRDKGLISQDSVLWVNRAGLLLQSVDLPVRVAIREAQRPQYAAAALSGFELLSDLDSPVGGPLKGILTFHNHYPQNDVLVLPCDMPNLTKGLLSELIQSYVQKPQFDAWVFEDQAQLQPFPGIYSSRMLSAVCEEVRRGELVRYGLKTLLATVKTARKTVCQEFSFQNQNTPF